MVERLYKKGLAVGIIVLFISMSGLTSVSSKDITVTEDDNEIEPLGTNFEILTHIRGYFYNITYTEESKRIYRNVTIYSDSDHTYLSICGIGFPLIFFLVFVGCVKIPCLIITKPIEEAFEEYYYFESVAFGNIYWSY